MSNYSVANIGKLDELEQHVFEPEGVPIKLVGKAFLGELIGLTSMEVSLNKDRPNTGVDFFHSHKNNEEVYVFIGGAGEMVVGEDRFPVKEGSVVRVATGVKRAWWNTGQEDLYYVVIQAPTDGLKTSKLNDAEMINENVPWT